MYSLGVQSKVFSILTVGVIHPSLLILECFHHPRRNLIIMSSHFPFPSLQPLAITNILSMSMNLPILDILYKWNHKMCGLGASLVVQWLRICLPMQGTRVQALVWEDPACRGSAGPMSHNYWACASGACAPQRERPGWWGARAPRWRVAPTCQNWRKPSHRNEDPTQP